MNTTYCKAFPDDCYLQFADINEEPSPYNVGFQQGVDITLCVALLIAWFYCKDKKEKK